MKILLLVFINEIETNLTLKKLNFLYLLCFKIAVIQFNPMYQPSGQSHNFPSCFVLTGYIGWKQSLQLKISSKLGLNKQISGNLLRKNAYRRLSWPDIMCFHTDRLALLVCH